MRCIFYPHSIVVIGVSEKADNLARNIIGNLKTFQFKGELYAVGRQKGEVYGVPISDSLDDVPDNLDLAVILTPAAIVARFFDQCGRKGIQRIVVESGGFSEFSEEGRRLEEELLMLAQKWNIRLVGPNCISVVNLDAGVCLPFTPIGRDAAQFGPASIIAQSGGVSMTYMGMLSASGIGANKVISIGNKADLDETDYIEYLMQDEGTETVCLYLESISNGRKLMEQSRLSSKPIIIHKANRSQASHTVAFSHTAALADDDRLVEAAFKQAGILRAEGFQDLVAIAEGLTLPPVRGKDLVIISRSGGHAVAAADAAERYGFRLPPLPDDFIQNVRSLFRADVIALTNPIDLGVIFDFEIYAQIVELCLRALSPDAILLINTYSHVEEEGAQKLALRVSEIVRETHLPIAFCVYAFSSDPQELQRRINLPVYNDIEIALRGLSASRDWNAWQETRLERESSFLLDMHEKGEKIQGDSQALPLDEALHLCQSAGIPTAPWDVADQPQEAVRIAERLGFPIALKLISSEITHKSDFGALALGVPDPSSVLEEAENLLKRSHALRPASQSPRLLVQRMAALGIELVLGGKRDPTFGPVVMFGLGGIYVELYNDVAFRVAPLSRLDAEQMISEVRGSQLLDGFRGQEPVDREGILQALLSLSRWMIEDPKLLEVDINPLIVTPTGALAVDARVLVIEGAGREGKVR